MSVKFAAPIFWLIIGMLLTTAIFKLKIFQGNMELKYIAKDELIAAEKVRLNKTGEKFEDANLFFGDVRRAVELAVKLGKNYETSCSKVIFTLAPIYGENVSSISKMVHQEIIAEMNRPKTSCVNEQLK